MRARGGRGGHPDKAGFLSGFPSSTFCGRPAEVAMFPIPTDRTLSIREIAEYWSGDIHPTVSPRKLRESMVQAWWRGEPLGANAPMPIDELRALYALYKSGSNDRVAFLVPRVDPLPTVTRREDGSIDVDVRVEIPLPNESPDSWTAENCKAALTAIANNWDETCFDVVIARIITGISVTHDQFFAWVNRHGFDRPTFWVTRPGATLKQAQGTQLAKAKAKKPGQETALKAITALWPKGIPSLSDKEVRGQIDDWLTTQKPRRSAPSIRTIRRAMGKP